MKLIKVFHATDKKNLDKIKVEGLRPLAKNRPKELQVADHAFDLVAERLGITHRRKGLFAWPKETNGAIEVEVDPEKALVLHQAWIDLAWGIVEGIFGRIPLDKQTEFRTMEPWELYNQMIGIRIPEGTVDDALRVLGEKYWRNGVLLKDYNKRTAKELTDAVIIMRRKFGGLMLWLDHEVVLGTEIIPIERIQINL